MTPRLHKLRELLWCSRLLAVAERAPSLFAPEVWGNVSAVVAERIAHDRFFAAAVERDSEAVFMVAAHSRVAELPHGMVGRLPIAPEQLGPLMNAPHYNAKDLERGPAWEQFFLRTGVKSFVVVLVPDLPPWLVLSLGISWRRTGGASEESIVLLQRVAALLAPMVPGCLYREHSRRWRAMVDRQPQGVVALDALRRVLAHNQAMLRLLGRSNTLEGMPFELLLRADCREKFVSACASEVDAPIELALQCADGSSIPVDLTLIPVASEGPTAWQLSVSDARARLEAERSLALKEAAEREAQKRLIQADRLASLGMLAAGVAHEINNPMTFVLLGVQQLERMVQQVPDEGNGASLRGRMTELLGELSEGAQRIVQIVGELKLFTRIPESTFSTPVDVNRLLMSAVTLAQAELRHRAQVDLDLGELPLLPGDHARLGQVFVNLLINAAQAIPMGDEENHVVSVRSRSEREKVVVEIRDTGVGIAPEVLGRIFDPFFTTKKPGEGTGLGLSISYDLVRRAGGSIEVESEVGRGTTFRVLLPIGEVSASDPPPRMREEPPSLVRRELRVLLVEDEPLLSAAVARALAPDCVVQSCATADQALDALERQTYDAILCDLRLPGKDGRQFFERVCLRWPSMARKFVFMTGAGLGEEFAAFVRETDRPVLEKPFEMSALVASIEAVMRGE